MIDRRRKIKIVQYSLLFLGIIIIFFTYSGKKDDPTDKILSEETKSKIVQNIPVDEKDNENVFYNIEYSGLDLSGNRYILKSDEAITKSSNSSSINLKKVSAKFYFKDETILYVFSDYGVYNNQTLDMKFSENVKVNYDNNKMSSDNAEYSNSQGYLTVTNNVKVSSVKGNLFADKLFFDIKKQTLDISAFNDNKINAKVNINEKRF